MGIILGCIADDLTGATDLGLTLSREGMRVVQVMGVPRSGDLPDDADAVVVALKSRTIPAADAVAQSLASARALLAAGASQLFFKYCSTFDSTDAGNIGPVAEALLDLVGAPLAIATPAFPANGRTVYQGRLFVGRQLLSESPMRDHPLTPMRDADLVAVLGRQTRLRVGLLPLAIVDGGTAAIASALADAEARGERLLIADALSDRHLRDLASAVADMPLLTGGSGLALGLPDAYRARGLVPDRASRSVARAPQGRAAILAGSCSAATRGQVARALASGMPAHAITPFDIAEGRAGAADLVAWAAAQPAGAPVLVYSTAEPDQVRAAQDSLGRDRAATLVEETLSAVATGLAERGFSRFIVAGGETAGAVVGALGVLSLAIGPEIEPGVPWTVASDPPLALALKSGNFGSADFFLTAWDRLP